MRNYVSAQANLRKLPGDPSLSQEQLVQGTVDTFSKVLVNCSISTYLKVKPSDQSDQDDVLSASQAQPIVASLIQNVLVSFKKNLNRNFLYMEFLHKKTASNTIVFPFYCIDMNKKNLFTKW